MEDYGCNNEGRRKRKNGEVTDIDGSTGEEEGIQKRSEEGRMRGGTEN